MSRILVIVFAAGSFAACASSGAVYTPRPFPMPGGGGTTAIPAPVDPSAPPVAIESAGCSTGSRAATRSIESGYRRPR